MTKWPLFRFAPFAVFAVTTGAPLRIENPNQSAEPAQVAIVGVDYAFVQPPAVLGAGPTLFSFQNRGTKRHELSIALLKAGVVAKSLMTGGERAPMSSRAVSDSVIGILIARPGERAGGQLWAHLLSGRSYVIICTLKDVPDAQPHTALGMIASFRVR